MATATDLAGNPRTNGVTVDMGAYEYFPPPPPADLRQFAIARGALYGAMVLSWSNGQANVLFCTNRSYTSSLSSWSMLSTNVQPPWTHATASNYPSVFYRLASGSQTSAYDVGKYDVAVLSGSIAWLSFPFAVQPGCDTLAKWLGRQLEARPFSLYDFPTVAHQATPGGTVQFNDYYIDDLGNGATNWVPDSAVMTDTGYLLFLPRDHGAAVITALGMVRTNGVTLQIPRPSIPWIGLSYPCDVAMGESGVTNLFSPPFHYSSYNFDSVDSQGVPGGSVRYADYRIDDWRGGATNFFPSVAGADIFNPGKGYLLFFGSGRAGTGTWTCIRPY